LHRIAPDLTVSAELVPRQNSKCQAKVATQGVGHPSIQMRNANYELEEVKTVPFCHNTSEDIDAVSFLVGFPERPQATRP
jgi:hypothetical protein